MTNEWIEKYKRENWAFPFGSMANAYGQTMKPKDIKEFKKDMKKIYALSQEFIEESLWEKPTEPVEIKKVQEFLSKLPPSNYTALDSKRDDNINRA
jgi:hypothetical protein